jgi:signal peptidase II
MLWACAVGILIADQWSKRTVQARAALGSSTRGSVVRFRFVRHQKRAYEQPHTRAGLVLSWILALVSAVVLHRFGLWFRSAPSLAGLGLALGGAASNLLDILRYRYIVNFIDLGWWPVFNLADVAILVGLTAAFLA